MAAADPDKDAYVEDLFQIRLADYQAAAATADGALAFSGPADLVNGMIDAAQTRIIGFSRQAVDTLRREHDALMRTTASPEYKRFMLDYGKKIRMVEMQLLNPPTTDPSKQAYDDIHRLLGCTAGGDVAADNKIQALALGGQIDVARRLLDAVWGRTKEYLRLEAANVHPPGTFQTLCKALEMSADQVKGWAKQGEQALATLRSIEAGLQAAYDAGQTWRKAACWDEISNIATTVSDLQDGYRLITGAEFAGMAGAETGIAPGLAAILAVSVVAGLGLEVTATILDVCDCIDRHTGGHSGAGKAATEAREYRGRFATVQKDCEWLMGRLNDFRKWGSLIRKVLHGARGKPVA